MRYEIISPCLLNILLMFACVSVSARICGNVKIANNLRDFEEQLRNCTIITGSLKILFLEKDEYSAEIQQYSFPELEEVLGMVLFYKVHYLTSLGTWFPNLRVIRGNEKLETASVIIYYAPDLREIGLKNLRLIEHGEVRIGECPDLCFASTINWASLKTKLILKQDNSKCPDCSKNCPSGYCWDEHTCQNTTFNECPHFEYQKECFDKCPDNTVSLRGGKTCIQEEMCRNLDPSYSNHTWFVFNGTCTSKCPTKYKYVLDQKTCEYCGDNCNITCDGVLIRSESNLEPYLNCNTVNGSLILHTIDDETYRKLPKYLGEIQEIREMLKIQRSSSIKNLNFLGNLRRIRGLKNGDNGTSAVNKSLVILDNYNLAKLWDLDNFSLVIENGGIWFHYNHKLCLNEIREFARNVGKNYTDLDVSPTSNGDQGICEHYAHNVKIVEITSRNVTLKWEVLNSTFEGYIAYYKEADRNDSESCGDDWNVVVGRANTPVVLTNLLPYTNYSYYFMMNSNSSHPYSRTKRFYLRTNPDDPPIPLKIRAISKQPDQMTLSWEHPLNPGGELSQYVISYYMEPDSKDFMDQRNYCKSSEMMHGSKKYETVFRQTQVPNDTCICPETHVKNKMYCTFLQSISLTDKYEQEDCPSIMYYEMFNEEFPITRGRAKRDYLREEMKQQLVNASYTSYDIVGLKHFRIYVFLISVCNKKFEDRELCSAIEMVYNRTLPSDSADDVTDFSVELKDKKFFLEWGEPADPNSVIVSYEVWHRVNGHMAPVVCIPRAVHENNSFVYVVRDLQAGEHDFQVRAISLASTGRFTKIIPRTIAEERTEVILVTLLCVAATVVCVVVGFYFYYRWKKKRELEQMYLIASINPDYTGITYTPDEWEIPRSDVEIHREIGQGSFGMVFSGFIKSKKIPCAVKTIADDASIDRHMEFLNEASMMKSFSNAHHVVKLLGVVSQCKPPLVVMELMECGDLKSFLRKSRDSSHAITNNEMYRMAAEIADGMAYLSAKKFVHRDLAARNCMVSGDHTIKIGDFGMTRDIYQADYYRKDSRGFFPVRWMAPESLADGVFSSDSDAWSYGIVLWEMSTLAEQPYQGLSNEQVLQFIINRGTLDRPPDCSDLLYEIMHVCWRYKHSQRPQFTDIVNKLQNFVGEDFRLVSYYHNREREEYKIKERTASSPQMLYAHYDISGDDVSIYNDQI